MTDLANLSETQRQGEATRAALGLQTRSRPLWSGAGRFGGINLRYVSPYRLRPVNSPEHVYENISYDGTVYVAEAAETSGNEVYISADLRNWTARTPVTGSYGAVRGGMVAAPSVIAQLAREGPYWAMYVSLDHGVTWELKPGAGPSDSVRAAGGMIYWFKYSASTTLKTITAATPDGVVRNLGVAQQWRHVLATATRTLVLNADISAGVWSANGIDGWATSAGLPIINTYMPAGTRYGYKLGNLFIVITVAHGTISSSISITANEWWVGAIGEMAPSGMSVVALGNGAELNGALYITATLSDGTNYWSAILATDSGSVFTWLPVISKIASGTTPPRICARADGTGLVFNGSPAAGTPTGERYESNPNALEVYLAV